MIDFERFGAGVYVMSAPAHPTWGVKIGATFSTSVASRARTIVGELPVDLAVLAYEPLCSEAEARACEQWLHREWASARWRGEWFQVDAGDDWTAWLGKQVRHGHARVCSAGLMRLTAEDLAAWSDEDLLSLSARIAVATFVRDLDAQYSGCFQLG